MILLSNNTDLKVYGMHSVASVLTCHVHTYIRFMNLMADVRSLLCCQFESMMWNNHANSIDMKITYIPIDPLTLYDNSLSLAYVMKR